MAAAATGARRRRGARTGALGGHFVRSLGLLSRRATVPLRRGLFVIGRRTIAAGGTVACRRRRKKTGKLVDHFPRLARLTGLPRLTRPGRLVGFLAKTARQDILLALLVELAADITLFAARTLLAIIARVTVAVASTAVVLAIVVLAIAVLAIAVLTALLAIVVGTIVVLTTARLAVAVPRLRHPAFAALLRIVVALLVIAALLLVALLRLAPEFPLLIGLLALIIVPLVAVAAPRTLVGIVATLLVHPVVAAVFVVARPAELPLLRLWVRRTVDVQNPEIMLGVLKQIFAENRVSHRLRVSGEDDVAIVDLVGRPPDAAFRPVTVQLGVAEVTRVAASRITATARSTRVQTNASSFMCRPWNRPVLRFFRRVENSGEDSENVTRWGRYRRSARDRTYSMRRN